MSETKRKPITIVVGGQWGSEGKGAVSAELCKRQDVEWAVRTGGVNAGHTIWYQGREYKMQQIPCGWVNPKTQLVIGAGAYINLGILHREIEQIDASGVDQRSYDGVSKVVDRLYIDGNAGLHGDHHQIRSAASDRHHKIGATGKGCSEAVIDRIRNRGTDTPTLYHHIIQDDDVWDTELLLNTAYDRGQKILLEGTQGQGLDLLLGPWPYTTHKPCSPAQWLVETGLSPKLETEIVMVCRTFPIRVAGNSGPMPGETTWDKVRPLSESATRAWGVASAKMAENYASESRLPVDPGMDLVMFDFHNWNPETRVKYKFALSEFHADVIAYIERMWPDDAREIRSKWEYTTVTKKLRRVAAWDHDFMKDMVRQVRPSYIVLTFLDYVFPSEAGKCGLDKLSHEAVRYIRDKEKELGVWIRYVTTGPRGENMIEVDETC